MQIDVVTTLHQAGYDFYGKRMIETFDQYWPKDINLHIYFEDVKHDLEFSDRLHKHNLHKSIPDLVDFKNKYKDNPQTNGSRMKDGSLNFALNHFKWDAVRFSNKVFVVTECALKLNSDYLIWLDADTHTFTTPPMDTIMEMLPGPNQYCSYLGRGMNYHSECGWVGYNLKHPLNQKFMQHWRHLYQSGEFLKLAEYHDSYVFDVVRKQFEQTEGMQNKNINPRPDEIKKGPRHPFIASKLGTFMDHLKGKRKRFGYSGDDAEGNQHLLYWQNRKKQKNAK